MKVLCIFYVCVCICACLLSAIAKTREPLGVLYMYTMWIRLALTMCLTLTARTCLAFVNGYQCGASVLSLLESGCTYVSAVVDPVGCE